MEYFEKIIFLLSTHLRQGCDQEYPQCYRVGGAKWLSGRVLDSRPRGRSFEPHWLHCAVSLSKNINPCLVLVQPRKTSLFITERLLMGRNELNQTNQTELENTLKFTFYISVCQSENFSSTRESSPGCM